MTGSCLGSFVTSRNPPLCCPMRFTTIFHNGFEHKFICQVAVVVVNNVIKVALFSFVNLK